jgi:predicted permease
MTWKYLGVLNVCIQTLLTVGLGGLIRYGRMVDAGTFVPQATAFVFHVALPCHILKGLGINVDFYDDRLLWNYICAFLILRAVALALCVAWVLLFTRGGPNDKGIGQVAVQWLALTWISTVILGVPIAGAVFGDPGLGLQYGVLAAISSFIFQLPLQLFFLECHLLEQQEDGFTNKTTSKAGAAAAAAAALERSASVGKHPPIGEESAVPGPTDACDMTKMVDVEEGGGDEEFEEVKIGNPNDDGCPPEEDGGSDRSDRGTDPSTAAVEEAGVVVPLSMWLIYFLRTDIWKKIAIQLLRNPIVWAVILGFILTLSTAGPRFLDPTSEDYIPGLGWIDLTLSWLGSCVSPVALLSMGVWMQAEWRKSLRLFEGCGSVYRMTAYMTSKLILIPLVMVGLAKAVRLDDQAGRAAVLLAALPISLASFSLASRYKIGEAVLSENVALGTLLVLPTILIWNIVMDALDLFPLPSA